MRVRKQRDTPARGKQPLDQRLRPRLNFFDALAVRYRRSPHRPVRIFSANVRRLAAFVDTVVPFAQAPLLFCLSTENWKRPQEELDFLMALLREYLILERAEIMEQNIRFTVIGRREGLPAHVLAEMDENIRVSSANTGMVTAASVPYRSCMVCAARI